MFSPFSDKPIDGNMYTFPTFSDKPADENMYMFPTFSAGAVEIFFKSKISDFIKLFYQFVFIIG